MIINLFTILAKGFAHIYINPKGFINWLIIIVVNNQAPNPSFKGGEAGIEIFSHIAKYKLIFTYQIGHIWPKNQNKCWYKTGSPPEAASKKLVLKFLSVNNIVKPEANTGNDNNNNTAVITIAQLNNVNFEYVIPLVLIFITVTMKFIAPNKEDIPDICNENITISTLGPECDCILDKGGYTVQPVPGPDSTNVDATANNNDGTNNQNEILFNLAKLISAQPNIKGTK